MVLEVFVQNYHELKLFLKSNYIANVVRPVFTLLFYALFVCNELLKCNIT